MRTRTGWAAVLTVTVAVTTQADDSTAPWEQGLPRVEATITEVGTGQYLWGSTLLLAAPDKFQGYWPDYGYRWSNAAYIELCGGTLNKDDGEAPNLGRVRLVAESGDETEQLIGVELRTRGGESTEMAENATEPADADAEFSVEELCALLDDETGRRRIETMVRLMAGTGINFLTTGKWDVKPFSYDQEINVVMGDYIPLWYGSGVYEGLDITDKVSWRAKGKPVVIWNSPGVVKLHKGYGKIPRKVFTLHDEPGYMLASMGGGTYTSTLDQAASFEVIKGAIDFSALEKAGLEIANMEIGALTLWADVAKYHEMEKLAEQKVWLVTENAIPVRSLVPDIRVGEKR
ncbi:MAG: hypothetical protein OXI15_14810 [Chromatiales bacterium]|nr:hypothetical protein [Chromatiales bacterium]